MNEKSAFLSCFKLVEDPRMDRRKRHKLLDILGVTICAVIAGADAWTEVEDYGREKREWLEKFLSLENGIPSHDTFGRVFALLDPGELEEAFAQWVRTLVGRLDGVVAIDGKTARRSHDGALDKSALHVVSAWASDAGLVLGQVATDQKSNEITAIPELLGMLDIRGSLVTIDAMGCQRKIAQNILDAGADYLLSVKGNQERLEEDIADEFSAAQADGFKHMKYSHFETLEKNRERIEKREYWLTEDVGGLGTLEKWPGLSAMIMCKRSRTAGGQTSTETHYYIASTAEGGAQKLGDAIRKHWGIENSLHWVLDIAFREDESRIRAGNAQRNMALLRKLAVNLLKNDKTSKRGIKNRRLRAGWSQQYMELLLRQF
jgi:predicted transposase YbfD/YdcC